MKISSKDLPVVCFVVTQHSESALSLCLRYSKTSCEATPPKKNPFPKTVNCQTVTLVTQKKSFLETVICYLLSVPQKNHFWKLSTVNCNAKMKSEVWGLKSEGVVFIILRKSFSVYSVSSVDFFSCLRPEIYHRNLDGIRRMVWVARAQEIFGGNLV